MKRSAFQRFDTEFQRWVAAYNEVHSHGVDANALLGALRNRIGDDRLSQIGSALLNGWLETEPGDGRGYFVRESDREGGRGGQFVIIHQGRGVVAPCWELYVQLADYAWLRTIAERHGQTVRLEDDLMDVTVRAGDTLVLYVEQKTEAPTAEKLVQHVRSYGRIGFALDDPDKSNDPLRKAKYLVRPSGRPLFLGVSAIGYQQLFRVEYDDGNKFELVDDDRPLSAPLADYPVASAEKPKPRSPVDPLAIEIQRLCPEVWVSVGSGRTAYNFYGPGEHGDSIILGVYETGVLWSDLTGLGDARAARLREALAEAGVALAENKQWAFWHMGNSPLNLAQLDPVTVADAVRTAISVPVGAERIRLSRTVYRDPSWPVRSCTTARS